MIWSFYALWRAPGWGLLEGVPLTPLATAFLFLVWWVWSIRRRLPFVAWVAALIAFKIVGGHALVERGFCASYFANDHWSGDAEPGLYGHRPSVTRIDTRLEFRHQRPRDLPLFFVNELRFNSLSQRPAELPYSVVWTGELVVRSNGPGTFYVRGAGVFASIDLDGYPVVAKRPDEEETRGQVRVRQGLRHLVVKLSGSYGAPRGFEGGLIDPISGKRQPLDGSHVVADRVRPWRLSIDWGLRWLGRAIDFMLMGIVVWCAGLALNELLARARRRTWRSSLLGLAGPVVLLDALRSALPFDGALVLQGVGSDPLTYEAYARDIVLHGPLMRLGATVGQGSAYYYQVLYPYFLAMSHLLFGEAVWGIYFVQRLLLALTVYGLWSLSALMLGGAFEVATVLLGIWFVYGRVAAWSQVLIGEMLFIPLFTLWASWLTAATARPSTKSMSTGSILTGLTALSRSTMLLAWPLVACALGLAYKRARKSFRPLVGLLVLSCVVVGLATLRNWIMSSTFVPVTSSFGVNLYLGNQPPRELALSRAGGPVAQVVKFAHDAPRVFLEGLGRKALFALGWFEALVPGSRAQPDLIATWVAALAGVLLIWARVELRTSRLASVIPAMLALSHFAAVVLIFPNQGDRLILPMYALMLPYAAIGPGLLLTKRRGFREANELAGRASRKWDDQHDRRSGTT